MFRTILLPVDLSALSEEACRAGCELARLHKATLHFLYVLPGYGYPVVAQYFPEDLEHKVEHQAKEELNGYVGRQALDGVAHEIHLRRGNVYTEILECAEEIKADLVVIASRSPHGLDRILMGSNAEKVARYAHCSVLLLRHPR